MAKAFIATLIPCEIRLPPGIKLHVSDSPLLDICASYIEDPRGFKIPHGIRIVSNGTYTDLSEAEDAARALAMTWTGLLCFTMGVKAAFPRPLCLLERLDKRGRYRVRMYFYDVLPLSPSRPLLTEMLTLIHQRIAALPSSDDSERVSLAIRWYLVGLGEADNATRFLAYWIGLEAIGDLLHNRLHKADRAACTVCQHPAGTDHRGSQGGMKHVLSVVSGRPELYGELNDARDRMFHGLRDLEQLIDTIANNVAFLEMALARGILEVITPQGSSKRTSAAPPLRTVNTIPQVILDGTFIDLSDRERAEVLYTDAIKVSCDIVTAENEEDGGLTRNVEMVLDMPDSLESHLVDRKLTWVAPPEWEWVP